MTTTQAPHPLALELARAAPRGRLLLAGVGGGRNLAAFAGRDLDAVDAGATPEAILRLAGSGREGVAAHRAPYDALPFADGRFAGVLATHVLQHGRRAEVAACARELLRVAAPGAVVHAALASRADARYGRGRPLEPGCRVEDDGEEAGVPHFYAERADLEALFAGVAELTCEERGVDGVVGRWAHRAPAGMVHWFVRAQR